MCNKVPAVFLEKSSSFNPQEGKEDLKWSTIAQKPRYSEQMESGVFVFCDSWKKRKVKNIGSRVAIRIISKGRPANPHGSLIH